LRPFPLYCCNIMEKIIYISDQTRKISYFLVKFENLIFSRQDKNAYQTYLLMKL
jgi:hypothetical protein